jgi:hypothetical protein
MLLCAHGLYLQNGQNLGWNLLPCFARSQPLRFCKISLCPAIAHKATIVLSVFTRSFPADEEEII